MSVKFNGCSCGSEKGCMAAPHCPTGALYYEPDLNQVFYDQEFCFDCGECLKICPAVKSN
ncbi:4Fe-4S dicluster domain-containing protein [Carboxydothermus ferrireducens]|uniref:Fe-S-cluster-containing hydrogenase component 2 n=1 Tax=Carboxydothermus ferrireducens DSM 11255 TaxID=1119529 RepID=A0ABX2R7Y2_9THEO|nr:hypothetical protein [Carboxydothermus ferrireducens]NYE56662.1 Fe-S-cluster-containing hydrogenase component 2 [Carboxydothermus ferrireducens DSM 11255]